jgi:glutamate synthase domain-containing protein 1
MGQFYEKDISGCGIVGFINESGKVVAGDQIITAMATMHERGNGLGGGFAAYGIYPEYADHYSFHMLLDHPKAKTETEEYLKSKCIIDLDEPIPTRQNAFVSNPPILWRYFLKLKPEMMQGHDEEDEIVRMVMDINAKIDGAFVASGGKNMGVFKGVGYPEDIGEYYRLEEYDAYTWTGHGRFPTNSQGWWGGAHPFSLLDWTVVHNGEISSYGINKRYLEHFGYQCTCFTDTEVLAYLFDLLIRKHKLPIEIAAKVMCAHFWDEIERMDDKEREIFRTLRLVYSSALVNGPFAVVVGHAHGIVGLSDRMKLRPLVAARDGDTLYIASEDSAIREICPRPEKVWMPRAGEPVIGLLKSSRKETSTSMERLGLFQMQYSS